MYATLKELILDLQNRFPGGKAAEVGVFKGETSKYVLQNWDGMLYMVDVWKGLDMKEYEDASNHFIHETAYRDTMSNIEGFEDRGIMIRSSSKIASDLFQENSLDWIWIDANHSYDHVKEDIDLWFPKLKKGGIFSGHDYIRVDWYNDPNFAQNGKDKYIYNNGNFCGVFGVNPAVDEFCAKHGYEISVTNEWFGTWYLIK